MKRVLCLLAVSLMLAAPANALGALDGKTFGGVAANKTKGPEQAQSADFAFVDGKLRSSFPGAAGYVPGKYTAVAENNAVRFEAQMANKAGGKIRWSGMVRGQDIEGVFTVAEDGRQDEYWFKGRLR